MKSYTNKVLLRHLACRFFRTLPPNVNNNRPVNDANCAVEGYQILVRTNHAHCTYSRCFGMNAAMHINPYYGKTSLDGLVAHYNTVLFIRATWKRMNEQKCLAQRDLLAQRIKTAQPKLAA
ncbi:hypothetical protein JHK86_001791 [Glycine max]|nr:hypothetical protein JHK86_001791 [Glycine max]